ncbi:mannitol dehydrogenase family protein [Amycolatopsis sp. NBC_00345]|uniref:mannitol dehydrogenase family protein n=1 Tax=Amycolatopsis sp. NBC_00345 TaxID=2975955 RepID=UPI002E276360
MKRLSTRVAAPARPDAAGIVHLGLGAFHRAHQAVYTEDAMRVTGDRGWGIIGVTQRSDRVRRQLEPQDNLYTVLERGEGAAAPRVVGALSGVVDGEAVPGLLARPSIQVVTLTVTEKGYRHDPATGELDLTDPGIAADLTGRQSKTVVGQLVHGLQRRAGGPPITLLCCDNLAGNGAFLCGLVLSFCAAAGLDSLTTWIEDNVRFPASMVDRIAPATTEVDRREAEDRLGYRDEALVVTEPFSQWVIEDDFAAPRPAWERVGAVLAKDVEPWERLKLRVLNASHSMLAYFGLLLGHESIADAVRDPVLRQACLGMIAEDVLPVLRPPSEVDVEDYAHTVLARFANPALRHTTAQVASDGSQKLGPRLLGTVADLRAAGRSPRWIPFVIAAWLRHVATDALRDPLAAELRAAASPLDVRRIFPDDAAFRDQVMAAHTRLTAADPRAVLREVLDERG